MDRTNPADLRASLARWRRRESEARRAWRAARKGTSARSAAFAQLKVAKRMVDRRERQLEALKPKAPTIVDLNLQITQKYGYLGPITAVIGHYTAGPVDDTPEEARSLFRRINDEHARLGWGGAGYHLGVGRDGSIYLLRPITWKGAHTAGANTGHVGIVMHGSTGDEPTAAQAASLRWLASFAHTDAMPKSHRATRRLGDVRWTGHNDWNATLCPGQFKTAYTTKGKRR